MDPSFSQVAVESRKTEARPPTSGVRWTLAGAESPEPPAPLEFRAIYEAWFHQVERWIRALGGPEAERADLAQDVFIVVHRRLPFFVGDNIGGWLYQIARHRVRDFRRLSWVRHLFLRSVPLVPGLLADHAASPAESVETHEKGAMLEQLLKKLNESERAALVLFEIEGYSGEQIAEVQGVSINTVWARIYKARGKLRAGLASREASRPRPRKCA